MRTIQEQTITNPVLFDAAVIEANKYLKKNIWWLDQCFGHASRYNRIVGDKSYIEPVIFTGNDNGYETLTPSADLGNYSFFVGRGSVSVTASNIVKSPFSFIVWLDVSRCFSTDIQRRQRNTELLKAELMQCLSNVPLRYVGAGVTIQQVYDEPSKVFEGFSLTETDNRFATHPYACFRIDGIFNLFMPCDL